MRARRPREDAKRKSRSPAIGSDLGNGRPENGCASHAKGNCPSNELPSRRTKMWPCPSVLLTSIHSYLLLSFISGSLQGCLPSTSSVAPGCSEAVTVGDFGLAFNSPFAQYT